ncbi:unnamed protein product [Rhizophagus irregularis]|nr:unnamed protein product [Rhizophagus irregularis]
MNIKNGGFETIRIYGVTCDSQSGEYAIVIQFKNGGNLRKMIKENYSNLTWENILEILKRISDGLCSVHNSNYFHKDLHSGNILSEIYNGNIIRSVISDFGNKEIKEAFNQEREDKWKARLPELATSSIPLKKSQNLLTSKRLDYSQHLSQKLSVEDWNKLKLTD